MGNLEFLGRARAQAAAERELLPVRRVRDLERTQLGAGALVELLGPLVAHELAILLLVVAHCGYGHTQHDKTSEKRSTFNYNNTESGY